MDKRKESVNDEDNARCPYCGMPQGNIDEYDEIGDIVNCEDCGKPFEITDISSETTWYFSTREWGPVLTEEEELALKERKERKPFPGQIDIFGKEVGKDSEFGR